MTTQLVCEKCGKVNATIDKNPAGCTISTNGGVGMIPDKAQGGKHMLGFVCSCGHSTLKRFNLDGDLGR